MKRIIISIFFVALLFSTVGCKKYLDINSDPDSPQAPSISSVFPAMLAGIPRGYQYDARYVGKYDQIWLASTAGDTWDRHGYLSGSDAAGDIWRQTYYGMGKNLDYIIEGGKQQSKFDYVGAAYTLKALMFQTCTDYHGEIIFNEAFKEGTYYFKYDVQEAVYRGIDSLCRIAIEYLDKASTQPGTLAIGDYSYNGNVGKWKKLAYGILARNYNNLSNKGTVLYKPDQVIAFVNNSFTSVDDDFLIPFDATKNDDTNFFGPYRNNLSTFRQSNFMVKLMNGTTLAGSTAFSNRDPRISHMLVASNDTTDVPGGYRGVDPNIGDPFNGITTGVNSRRRVPVPWGDSIYANPSTAVFTANAGKFLFKDKAVMPVMTYAELQFIKAEAAFRKGDKTTALTAYTAGINGHFDFINRSYGSLRGAANIFNTSPISATQRAAYLAGNNVKRTEAALTLTDIMLQKYIALWGWGWVETWTDLRRYHYLDLDPATGEQVYKGFMLPASLAPDNLNKPAYRVRPRYNSEYVWNLEELKRFGGEKPDYHTYQTWISLP